jgi:hypothetical protein
MECAMNSIARPVVSIVDNPRGGGKTFEVDATHWKARLLRTTKKSPTELRSSEPIPLSDKVDTMSEWIEDRLSAIESGEVDPGSIFKRWVDNGYFIWVSKLESDEESLGI